MTELKGKHSRRGSRLLLVAAIIVGGASLWHLRLVGQARDRAEEVYVLSQEQGMPLELAVNPFTNVLSVTATLPPELTDTDENPFAGVGAALVETALENLGPGVLERELNTRAREQYDLYAILVPYRVRIDVVGASSETIAKRQADRDQQREKEKARKAEATRRRREKVRAYIADYLQLEDVRVSQGERYGKKVMGVFGTVVNVGQQTLTKVKVRVYFLDEDDQRIGEKEYHPVLVTEYFSSDDTPLRPNYRRDFGFSVEDDAPSGWNREIEVEIVDLEFSDAIED